MPWLTVLGGWKLRRFNTREYVEVRACEEYFEETF